MHSARKLLRYMASLLPLSAGLRTWLYRLSGLRVGVDTVIDRNLQVTRADLIEIGSRVTLCNGVSLLAEITAVHSRLEEVYGIRKTAPVVIEDDAYLGVRATILPGVRIGRMATVAANSLVMSDVPPYGIALGVPARLMMIRPHETDDAELSPSGS